MNKEELAKAMIEARQMAHPMHIGLTAQDQAEIRAYQAALDNLELILRRKGLL